MPQSTCPQRRWLWKALYIVACAAWAVQCSRSPVAEEARRLVRDAGIVNASVIAEIGAGDGRFAVELGRCLGKHARIYATELGQKNVALLWKGLQRGGAPNMRIVEGRADSTVLPDDSCDVVVLRRTYHHFSQPADMARSIWKTLRKDGLLVAIEQPFMPQSKSRQTGPRPGGDGIDATDLSQELALAGFLQVKTIGAWSGRLYLSVFRKTP